VMAEDVTAWIVQAIASAGMEDVEKSEVGKRRAQMDRSASKVRSVINILVRGGTDQVLGVQQQPRAIERR
jgi:hypothetical protein